MKDEPDARAEEATENDNLCRDMNEDCLDVVCHLYCFLYDPEQGNCPFLPPQPTGRNEL